MAQGLNSKRSIVLMDEVKDRLFTLSQRGYYVNRMLEDLRNMKQLLLTEMDKRLKQKRENDELADPKDHSR